MWDARKLFGIVVLTVSIGCAEPRGGDGGPIGPGTPPPTGGNTIVMGSNQFYPPTLSILRNETVTWSNTSGALHNVTFSSGGAPANIPDHTSGSTDRTFTTLGTFVYACTQHGGMTGSVTVQ